MQGDISVFIITAKLPIKLFAMKSNIKSEVGVHLENISVS